MSRKYITVKVSSHNEELLTKFIRLCKTMGYLSGVGSTRDIHLWVDGDGSADLDFDFGKLDVDGIKLPPEKSDGYHIDFE